MWILFKLAIMACILVDSLYATPKYSTPIEKSKPFKIQQPPALQTGSVKNYVDGSVKNFVDFDLKSQSSRFGKDEQLHYSYSPYDHYYSSYDYSPYHNGKGHDHHYMIPYILGGFGILLLPILTLMLTLAVNIAPASNIPTAVTTATGKLVDSFNASKIIAEIQNHIEEAFKNP